MSEGICQTVVVDGEPVLVRVTSLLTPEEVEAFAWIVRAARRRFAAEQAEAPCDAAMRTALNREDE